MVAAIVLAVAVVGLIVASSAVVLIVKAYTRKARRSGYDSLGDYLRAAPRSDEEKRDAVDLALKGVVVCICGLLFPPLLLIGLIPLYYGGRKLAYSSLGLGLFEDAVPPSA